MNISPNGRSLGARIEGVNLTEPLIRADVRTILRALGTARSYMFSRASPSTLPALAAFGRSFGPLEINSPIWSA